VADALAKTTYTFDDARHPIKKIYDRKGKGGRILSLSSSSRRKNKKDGSFILKENVKTLHSCRYNADMQREQH